MRLEGGGYCGALRGWGECVAKWLSICAARLAAEGLGRSSRPQTALHLHDMACMCRATTRVMCPATPWEGGGGRAGATGTAIDKCLYRAPPCGQGWHVLRGSTHIGLGWGHKPCMLELSSPKRIESGCRLTSSLWCRRKQPLRCLSTHNLDGQTPTAKAYGCARRMGHDRSNEQRCARIAWQCNTSPDTSSPSDSCLDRPSNVCFS